MKVQVWQGKNSKYDIATYIDVENYNLLCFKEIQYDVLIDKSAYKIGDFILSPGQDYEQIGYQNKTSSGYVFYKGDKITFYGYYDDYLLFLKKNAKAKKANGYQAIFFAFQILDENNLFTLNSSGSGRVIEMKKTEVKTKKTVPAVQKTNEIKFNDGDLVMFREDNNLTGTIENNYNNELDIVLVNMDDGRHLTLRKSDIVKITEVQSEPVVTPEQQSEKTVLAKNKKNVVQDLTEKNNCTYYPGQKNIEGVYQKIINEIPEISRYIELFAGTGAMAKIIKKESPGTKVICNDINPDVAGKINFTDNHATTIDAITYLKNNQDKLNNNDFIFLDPPYHPETRPNSLNLYKYELSIEDHEQLISSVLKLRCPVMIIHPECDLYDDALILDNGWRHLDLKIRYHNKTSHERLYMNYPAPKKLLITKFLGKDCWDRQRIKRKGDRMIAKLKALPAPELQYILEKINNEIKI